MEVYITNNVSGKGLWVALPKTTQELLLFLEQNQLTDNGEYQMTSLRINPLPQQECTGNLFLLNQKAIQFEYLPDGEKENLLSLAFDEGISIEEAFYQYL
ncbi:MAG: hypothetical protein E7299_02960 [Lachnospiraceae bacterium]|nr:hypothetical protein [Lachnospiraceae bacterium]